MIIKLKPIFFTKVWGGDLLHKKYNYDCDNLTGEAWGISAHSHGSSIIKNGLYKGLTLKELFNTQKQLFGNYPQKEFPILIKLIDAQDDLSVQVHPGDDYAKKHENSLGKTECWVVLDTLATTQMIIGHRMSSKPEFISAIKQNNWDAILNKFFIHKDEIYCVPSGTIHAICKGTLLLEIQQSSDITYRLYDYNRLDNGSLRKLHIDKALDVINFPDKSINHPIPKQLFDFKIINNIGTLVKQADQYGDYIFIIDGVGLIDNEHIKKGDFIFVTSNTKYQVSGSIKYFYANIK